MAFTFKKAIDGISIGNSLFDEAGAAKAQSLLDKAKAKGVKVVLPVDYITADDFNKNANVRLPEPSLETHGDPFAERLLCTNLQTDTATDASGIPEGWMGLDAGPKSRELFKTVVSEAKTILWNGPAGVFEFEKFAGGSQALLEATIGACEKGATVIVGGGCVVPLVPSRPGRLLYVTSADRGNSSLASSQRHRHLGRQRRQGGQALARLDRWRCLPRAAGGQRFDP